MAPQCAPSPQSTGRQFSELLGEFASEGRDTFEQKCPFVQVGLFSRLILNEINVIQVQDFVWTRAFRRGGLELALGFFDGKVQIFVRDGHGQILT